MKFKLRYIIVGLLLLISFNGKSQQSAVLFNSEEPFKISINQFKLHQNFVNALYVDSLKANNKYQIEVTFEKDTLKVKEVLYLFDNEFIHLYTVDTNGLHLTKMQPLLTYDLPDNITETSYTGKALPLVTENKNDSTKNDTSYKVPFENYYKLDDYTGKIGCPFPIKEDELAELKRLIIAENLEDNKLEKAKMTIQEMDSACVLVEQTKELITLLEFEETKLAFAKFMYAFTFDLENYKEMSEVFNFENSMDELNEFIKTREEKEEESDGKK